MESDTSSPPGPPAHDVFDRLPLNLATLDESGTIVDTNRAWREFGVANGIATSPDCIGVNYLGVTEAAVADEGDGGSDARRAAAGIREVLAGDRELFTMEYPCHSPSEERWFLLRAAPVLGDDDRHAVVAHVDVTDQVLAEQRADRRRDEMAADREQLTLVNQLLRHDLRNDLNLIAGFGDLLGEHVDPTGEHYLERMLDAADHTLELVDAVGEFVEFVEGTDEPLVRTDLSEVLTVEIDRLRTEYEGRPTAVTVTGPGPREDGIEVPATPLLSSVFSNLLHNAVFHNDKADVRIEVTVEERDSTVVVRVADNGPGVPDAHKRTLFGRGEKRAESTGLGLGLYLVDALVRFYDGSAWIEDAEPEGAVFCVELPLADASGED